MTTKRKSLLLTFTLILVICCSFYIINHSKKTHAQQPSSSSAETFAAFMTDVAYSEYNNKGQLQARIFSSNMKYYEQTQSIHFDKPKILVYTKKRKPWGITAEFGESLNDNQQIHLWKNVTLHQSKHKGNAETTINTSELTIYPQKSYAESQREVTIHHLNAVAQGKGVQADFKNGIIKLLAQSRGLYVPQPKHKN